jgi:enoyl-CoA hydratase
MFGEKADGAKAEQIGLAWRCVPDDELLEIATSLAVRAASAPPGLIVRIKESIAEMRLMASHEDAVDHELIKQIWSIGQPGFRERIADLQQKLGGSAPTTPASDSGPDSGPTTTASPIRGTY